MISLSIVVPSDEIQSTSFKRKGGGYPFLFSDKSLWSSVVYEIWDVEKIQKDLISKIEIITNQVQNYRRFQTFSRKKCIEFKQKILIEGIFILWLRGHHEKTWNLIPLLQKLSVEIRNFLREMKQKESS